MFTGMSSNASELGNKLEDKYAVKFKINADYLTQEFVDSVRAGIEGNSILFALLMFILGKGENSVPFPHFQLQNFIENAEMVEHLRNELLQAKYFRNDNGECFCLLFSFQEMFRFEFSVTDY